MTKMIVKLLVLLLVSSSLSISAVFATESPTQTHVVLEKNQIVNKDYFAAGDSVTILGTINGDAYLAGGSVIVDGAINGDLLVAAGSVQIRGPVKNDIRAVGGNITISSSVGGNVTLGTGNASIAPTARIGGSLLAGAGNMEIFGPVSRGVTAGVGNFTINNRVGGDLLAGVGKLSLLPETVINGNVNYWSEDEASIASGSAISGAITRHEPTQVGTKKEMKFIARGGIAAAVAAIAGVAATFAVIGLFVSFILGLIIFRLIPVFTDKTVAVMNKNAWGSAGVGLVAVIVIPVVAIILLMTVVGIPVGLFLFAALGLLCFVAHIYAALFVGTGILGWFNAGAKRGWSLLVGLIVLALLTLIPFLGWLVKSVFILIALGALVKEKQLVYSHLRSKNLL